MRTSVKHNEVYQALYNKLIEEFGDSFILHHMEGMPRALIWHVADKNAKTSKGIDMMLSCKLSNNRPLFKVLYMPCEYTKREDGQYIMTKKMQQRYDYLECSSFDISRLKNMIKELAKCYLV